MFALYLVQKKEWKGCYLFLLNVVYNLLCNILAVSLIAEGNIEYITSAKSYFTIYQGRNMVYPGPIDPYFLAVILIPEPHFPQNFDPWALIKKLIPSMFSHKI